MKRRAFTLIELLIVIAIISILASATFGLIVMPLREQVLLEMDSRMHRGATVTFGTLVQDFHLAETVTLPSEENSDLLIESASGERIVYTLQDRRLYRQRGEDRSGALMMEWVSEWNVQSVTSSRYEVTLAAEVVHFERPMSYSRTVTLTTEKPWLQKGSQP